ncbi:2,3-diaminopropionate biosynthesis protein SbnA, partial [Streptomyces sp. NPDC059468]
LTAVAVAPDLGERYLDTIYQTNWLQDLYGDHILDDEEVNALPGKDESTSESPDRRSAP